MRRAVIVLSILLIATGNLARPAGHTQPFSVRIVNSSNAEIREVHLAWSGTGRWGPDVLGRQVLKPGASFVIGNVSSGDYEILFVNTGGHGCVAGPIRVYSDVTFQLTDRNCRSVN